MFKQFSDGVNTTRIMRLLKHARGAMEIGRIDLVRENVELAYELSLKTTFVRDFLINLIFDWNMLGIDLQSHDCADLSVACTKMGSLLQARFNAGEYYRNG